MRSKLIVMNGKMIVVTTPPKLPNATELEKKILAHTKGKKVRLDIDKKPLG